MPGRVAELERVRIRPGEIAVDRGFKTGPTNTAFADLPTEDGADLWPPGTRPEGAAASCGATQDRGGGPDQPQTVLPAGPIPPAGRRGPTRLD